MNFVGACSLDPQRRRNAFRVAHFKSNIRDHNGLLPYASKGVAFSYDSTPMSKKVNILKHSLIACAHQILSMSLMDGIMLVPMQ